MQEPMNYEAYRLAKERGFFGHEGRPGQRGGSARRDGEQMASNEKQGDEDPADAQAQQDLMEVAGVYGFKVVGLKQKDGSIRVGVKKEGMNPWKMDFVDYIEAMDWIQKNVGQVAKR